MTKMLCDIYKAKRYYRINIDIGILPCWEMKYISMTESSINMQRIYSFYSSIIIMQWADALDIPNTGAEITSVEYSPPSSLKQEPVLGNKKSKDKSYIWQNQSKS